VESVPPARLVTTWSVPDREGVDEPSRVTFDLEPHGPIVRLTVTHENLFDASDQTEVSFGWPAVLSNLKTLIETGSPLATEPWLSNR
ncbi:MAG TPA: SRPBCC domain-containing protein, partial [Actinophytocola sp.]|uniref:SRPBCC domain-containing protein n=1 Tax=Actinophytocola sp. TaxID=1872138 RepID=UPI002DBE96DE